ncbi:uncharacterized protein G2W53_004325 [Senna tora]|uniref:Uncharacterized protein n=1 Tax=Senna tora TaxID=362788 RepID=A0A835CK33_9FABA|nr:uncharacterized protein G2W53_004325 [Senna tora]
MYKFKRVVGQVSQNDRFALHLQIREDLMLKRALSSNGIFRTANRNCISKELKKYKFKRVFGQVSQNDRFALYLGIQVLKKYKFKHVAQVNQNDRIVLYLGIRVDSRLEWGS